MEIGDWEVEIIKEEEMIMEPGNVSSPKQHMVFYNFLHKPTGRLFSRSVHYIKPHDNTMRLTVITKLSEEMKKAFVDLVEL